MFAGACIVTIMIMLERGITMELDITPVFAGDTVINHL